MKNILFILIVILNLAVGYSQKQGNIWYFGDSAGVDFNSGVPVALTDGKIVFANHTGPLGNPLNYNEGTAVISDSSGNLLFYTDGQIIWNRNHQIMPNGDTLFGNFSATQSSIIVPWPGSNQLFYVFTVDDYWENNLEYGFRYSIVDICLDNGFGDVMQNQKNVLLLDTVAEKVAVVRHSNGIDYWVITHKLYTNEFFSYKLTSTGISDTIISSIGSVHAKVQGQMKVSPNGNRIALAANQWFGLPCYFELFDFDNSTGILSNTIPLTPPTNANIYGVEFSPDNSKLYATYGSLSPAGMGIVEYDLNAGTPTDINNSMIAVYQNNSITLRGLQLGPDDKIYQGGITNNGYLIAINSPNNYGVPCGVQDSAVYLGGQICSDGLPTFIAGYSYSNKTYGCIEGIEDENMTVTVSIIPNPFSSQTTLQTDITLYNATLTVYNSFGQSVKQINDINEQSITLDRDKLPNGMYFFRLTENNKVVAIKKVMISN